MPNHALEIPFKLPHYVIAPVKSRRLTETDYSLYVKIGRHKPAPIGRLTVKDDGSVELVKSRFHATEVQIRAWDEVVRVLTGVEGLPVKFVSINYTEGE